MKNIFSCKLYKFRKIERLRNFRTLSKEFLSLVICAKMAENILQEATELFEKQFKTKPTIAAFAPGRVNLIGEHTDYNDGFVLPMVREYV